MHARRHSIGLWGGGIAFVANERLESSRGSDDEHEDENGGDVSELEFMR